MAHIMTEKSFRRHSESVLESAVKAENVEIVRLATTWINRGLPQWEVRIFEALARHLFPVIGAKCTSNRNIMDP